MRQMLSVAVSFYFCPFVLQVAPTSSKQHGVNVSVNASATPFQQPSGYGSHGYNTGKFPLALVQWSVWDITRWEKDLVFESGSLR